MTMNDNFFIDDNCIGAASRRIYIKILRKQAFRHREVLLFDIIIPRRRCSIAKSSKRSPKKPCGARICFLHKLP